MSWLDTLVYGYRLVFGGAGELPQRGVLEFRGPGVSVTDDPATQRTVVEVVPPAPPAGRVILCEVGEYLYDEWSLSAGVDLIVLSLGELRSGDVITAWLSVEKIERELGHFAFKATLATLIDDEVSPVAEKELRLLTHEDDGAPTKYEQALSWSFRFEVDASEPQPLWLHLSPSFVGSAYATTIELAATVTR